MEKIKRYVSHVEIQQYFESLIDLVIRRDLLSAYELICSNCQALFLLSKEKLEEFLGKSSQSFTRHYLETGDIGKLALVCSMAEYADFSKVQGSGTFEIVDGQKSESRLQVKVSNGIKETLAKLLVSDDWSDRPDPQTLS